LKPQAESSKAAATAAVKGVFMVFLL
jgi:hypothetical protein